MPLHRRLPKHGFTNIFKKEFQVVNIEEFARCASSEITAATLMQAGVIRTAALPLKVLGNGTIEKAYSVKAAAFSKSAVEKITAAGGKTEVLE